MTFKTRFAPSPSGPLHLGHAYSAWVAHDLARDAAGEFLLRIEDIDQSRARAEWEDQIFENLAWLGMTWDGAVRRQSDHLAAYAEALDVLWGQGLLYPCTCNRRDIIEATRAPQEGVQILGPDGVIYPGTCRTRYDRTGARPRHVALRLDMARALDRLSQPLFYDEVGARPGTVSVTSPRSRIGDVVLARKEMGTSYHLSVVVDDAEQGITHVVRGMDLTEATGIHVILQRLLGFETPVYHHHRLIRDEAGNRLAKRDDARAIARYRTDGASPDSIRALVGLPPRIVAR